MPTIFRRTPATSRAMDYGYRDFLRDVVENIREGASRNVERFLAGEVESQELLDMALAGVGGVMEFSKAPKAARELMKLFQKEGLKYDAFVNPFPENPEFSYHQWTLYGENPAKGATFGTKTANVGEMKNSIAELIRKFSE